MPIVNRLRGVTVRSMTYKPNDPGSNPSNADYYFFVLRRKAAHFGVA